MAFFTIRIWRCKISFDWADIIAQLINIIVVSSSASADTPAVVESIGQEMLVGGIGCVAQEEGEGPNSLGGVDDLQEDIGGLGCGG